MRVGIIGDPHFPFVHPMYLRFLQDVFDQWAVDTVVNIGDVSDNHATSFHEHDPDGHSASAEADKVQECVDEWQAVWKKKRVCIGNHDERNFRAAKRAGLPARFLRDYGSVWGTPGWKWEFSHTIDGVRYTHGTGTSGKNAAINSAITSRTSTVIGHVHAFAGVQWHTNDTSSIFGMNVGCGIDCRSYAFAYGRDFPNRPVLACGVVIDGRFAYCIPMPCSPKDPYHRGRA